jgi:hypothetical protein
MLDTEVQGGFVFGVVHPKAQSLIAGTNSLSKSGAGLLLRPQQAKSIAPPQINLCWTGRDWAISYPLDNPQKQDPLGRSSNFN